MTLVAKASVVLVLFSSVSAAQIKVNDYVKNVPVGERVSLTISPMHPSLDVPALLKITDLVVEGVIDRGVSAVTKDERFVSTTYDLRVLRVLFSHKTSMPVPGPGISVLKVTHPGGQATVEGRILVAIDTTLAPFAPGARLVLFLKENPLESGTYEIVDGPYGCFGVQDGRIRSFLEADSDMRARYDGIEFSALEEIVRSGSGRR